MALRLAVIPARGGSKRIPRKNLKLFHGKPILAYSIEAVSRSGVVDRVLVSTDDEAIAAEARRWGAETPFVRPAALSDDHTPTVPVIKHAIEWAAAHWGEVADVCCIYATAPFSTAEDVAAAHRVLHDEHVTGYVFTAAKFPFPIQRAFRIKADGRCEMPHPENYNTRSQDLEEMYQDAGQFYWGSAATYLSEKIFFATDSRPFVIPRHRVQDIDTPEDWARAELMYQAWTGARRA